MFRVKWSGPSGIEKNLYFPNLDSAMEFSKSLGVFVSITNGTFEAVGKFGVDSVIHGHLPDGTDYGWYKRRRP